MIVYRCGIDYSFNKIEELVLNGLEVFKFFICLGRFDRVYGKCVYR